MKKIKLVLLVSIIISFGLLVYGCSTSTSTSGGGGSNYFPHGEGYTWRTTSTDGSSAIVTFEGTATVDSTTVQIYKQTYFTSSGSMLGTSETYFQVTDSAVNLYGSPSYPLIPAQTFLQFPLEVGNSWTVASSGSITLVASVTDSSSVTVPAGTFNCYRIDFVTSYATRDETYTTSYWLAENVGMVKAATSSSSNETELEWKSF